jgi:hypothetical protein
MALRPSQRAANVSYYWRNRDREIARVSLRQASAVAFLRDLRGSWCLDCGLEFEPQQLDFDHRNPSLKRFRLTAGAARLRPRATVLDEARKSDVVCANCHRVRTQARHARRDIAPRDSPNLARKREAWRRQAGLLDALRDVPCADCARRFPPCAMDFDHRDPDTKRQAVTRMIGRAGTERILAEVAKCDIVCANCHRLRTFERRVAGRQARE